MAPRPYDQLSDAQSPDSVSQARRLDLASPAPPDTFAAIWDEAGAAAVAVQRQVSVRHEEDSIQRFRTAPAGWSGWVEATRAAAAAAAAAPAAISSPSLPDTASRPAALAREAAEAAPALTVDAELSRPAGHGVWFAGLSDEDSAELGPPDDAAPKSRRPAAALQIETEPRDASTVRFRRDGRSASPLTRPGSPGRRTGRLHRTPGPPLILARSSFGLSARKLSTWDAFTLTIETMWGVIIFLKLGGLVIESGLLLTLAVIGACTLVQVLNSLACSAVATNGLHSGAYKLLVANLGGTWGAATSLLYYLGMTALATVEICGAVEAVDTLLQQLPWGPDFVTTSIYYDTGVLGSLSLVVLAVLRGVNSHAVHAIGMAVVVVLMVTLASTLTGALSTFSHANLASNTHPPLGWDAVGYSQLSRLFTFIYPCFGGLFQPVNKAAKLRTPYTSVPKAMIGAVLFTGAGLALIVTSIAGSARRGLLDEADFLLRAWPSSYVGLSGTIIVGVGSCVSCLDVAPTIVASIADEGYVPFLKPLGLHLLSGKHSEPQRATAFTLVLAVPFAWLGGLELVALAAGALFLQMYMTMDLCCCLLAALRSPGWRPRWPNPKSFPLASFAGAATVLCGIVFYFLNAELAPIMLALSVLLGMTISWISGDSEMGGEAVAGLFYTVALQALHALNEDVSLYDAYGAVRHPRSWRPQLLCLIQSPSTLGASAPAPHSRDAPLRALSSLSDRGDGPSVEPSAEELVAGVVAGEPTPGAEEARLDAEAGAVFALAHHLKEGRGLTVAATVVTRGAPDVCEHDLFVLAKERIMRLADRARLVCFADATVSPFYGLAVGVVINCVGVGALRPNTLLVGWRFYDPPPTQAGRSSGGAGRGTPRGSAAEGSAAEGVAGGGAAAAEEAAAAAARSRGESELASELVQGVERAIGFGKAVLLLCTHAGDAPWDRGYRREHPLSKRSTIDIWWLDQRGALPLIIAHLLQRHEALSCCKLRVFMPTQETRDGGSGSDPDVPTPRDTRFPNASLAELHLRSFLALLRIRAAHVEVVRELVNVHPDFPQSPDGWAKKSVSSAESREHSAATRNAPPTRSSCFFPQLSCISPSDTDAGSAAATTPPPLLHRGSSNLGSSAHADGGADAPLKAASSEDANPVTAMRLLNLTIRRRITSDTLLVITDLPAPDELHSAAPLSYTSLLRRACDRLPPTLFVYGGTAHGEPQVYAHAH